MPRDQKPEDRGPAFAPVTDDELHGYYYEDLSVGMTAVFSRTITEADIAAFAGVSGDTNPVHLSEQFGKGGMFEGRIAHGMLSGSFISTLIGTKLPGPGAIYMGQTLKFMAPVGIGETVNTRATVRELNDEKARCILDTVCMVGDTVVIEGEAMIKVPLRNPPKD
jgi:3-hydroxybutyryl-CoA dehydratase